ncbi:MAG: hypothetical protein P8K08_26765 [Fuerstiella sp.]|nr:hypothetical protein [Fuerstiella sp.]
MYLFVPSDIGAAETQANAAAPSAVEVLVPDERPFDQFSGALNAGCWRRGVIGIAMETVPSAPAVLRFFEATGVPYVMTCHAKWIGDPKGGAFLGRCYRLPECSISV